MALIYVNLQALKRVLMTDDTIENLIDSLNDKQTNELIFLSELSGNVLYARVWLHDPKGGIGNEGSYPFYFIRDDECTYVGAVLDMVSDLHIFVKEKYRKRGHLSQAMNQVVFPYLFQQGREYQKITFKDPTIGEYAQKHWGFEVIDEMTAGKDLSCYAQTEKILPKIRKMTEEEFYSIKKKTDKARLYITMAAEQVESICGQGNDANLKGWASELTWLDDDVRDFVEELRRDMQ